MAIGYSTCMSTITRAQYMSMATVTPKSTAHWFNAVLPPELPSKTKGQSMTRKAWEKRVASCLLKAARLYEKVYQFDYGEKTSGAEDYVPEGWDTSKAIKTLGCDLAVEEHVFEIVTSIAFEALGDSGWTRDDEGAERWVRVLSYKGKDLSWLRCEADRLLYRGPGFWSDEVQFETREDGLVTMILVSHNEGE